MILPVAASSLRMVLPTVAPAREVALLPILVLQVLLVLPGEGRTRTVRPIRRRDPSCSSCKKETLVQVVLGNDEEGGQGPDEKAKVKLAVDLAEDFEKPNEKERGLRAGLR